MTKILDEALAERNWWNEIAALFDTEVHSWTERYNATFVDGLQIHSSAIAERLKELADLRAETDRLRKLCGYAERALRDPSPLERYLIDELRCQLKRAAVAKGGKGG